VCVVKLYAHWGLCESVCPAALLANLGFRNSRFHFRPPALLANPGYQNSRFHFRPPALLANLGFRNSRFHFRPPALQLANLGFRNSRFHFRPANPGFRNSRFHFRPPALLANLGFRNSRFHFRTMAKHSYSIAIKDSRGLSELSEARNSCYVAIWTDSPPLFFIATPDRCR